MNTIRRFSSNISELKNSLHKILRTFFRLVDFIKNQFNADMRFSKCAIPIFEGLLPKPQNSNILWLLFVCAHWHGLAKLRMHTDQTLDIMDNQMTEMGAEFCAFSNKTCSAFDIQELPCESAARRCWKWKKTQVKETSTVPMNLADDLDELLPKKFSWQTYKYHALGDYVDTIHRYGTSDSFSTEPVCNICNIQMICTDCIIQSRVNLNTVHQRLGINAQIKQDMSGSLLELSEGRPTFSLSEQGCLLNPEFEAK